ncbi:MAG: hypothetical protein QOG16_570 [Actinomycetota bacterium]|jgi:hypothetical protein|nr:hypothetical protein [Actinomycetota bacterium]
MGPDRAKQFMKKNSDQIPAGENAQGVIIAEAKGGAWRRGWAEAAGEGQDSDEHADSEKARGEARQAGGGGDAAAWPAATIFWCVITDKQLHVFEGAVNTQNLGAGKASYPLERIKSMDYDKKLLISKLTVNFQDGSAIELDVSKQKVQPFIDATQKV